jgi:hypothetical protein
MAERALTAVIQEAYIQGISTRSVDYPVKAMDMSGISRASEPQPIVLRQAQDEGATGRTGGSTLPT